MNTDAKALYIRFITVYRRKSQVRNWKFIPAKCLERHLKTSTFKRNEV